MSDVSDVNEIHRRTRHYRKVPVVIHATQWFHNGDHPEDRIGAQEQDPIYPDHTYTRVEGAVVRYFRNPSKPGEAECLYCGKIYHLHGWIDTLEGGHIVCPGDFVITGVDGEKYPCKPDIFARTYEEVEAFEEELLTALNTVPDPDA